jgi:undecaprenyl-diphosphatase
VHSHVPPAYNGFFNAITFTGSAEFLVSASTVAVIALLAARRKVEALLMAASMVTAPLAIYALKSAFERTRPALWDAPWYWGSSFPSGHTLSTTAFAVASVLCIARIWPLQRGPVMLATVIAVLWTLGVALSRLVIGVHWPTDVLASLGLGVVIPLFFAVMFDLYQRGQPRRN